MTTDRFSEILRKRSEEEKEAINEDVVEVSAEGIIQNHPDIENRAGLALTGMTVEEALLA